jgi:hypothetical protein
MLLMKHSKEKLKSNGNTISVVNLHVGSGRRVAVEVWWCIGGVEVWCKGVGGGWASRSSHWA